MSPAPRTRRLDGADAISYPGGRTGVLLCHGYTSTPQSLGDWATALAAEGFSVEVPLLPGHGLDWRALAGTTWTDWYAAVETAFADLSQRCDEVFVMGLSMGATLGLRLAEQRGKEVAGLVLVNPSLLTSRKLAALAPILKYAVRSSPGLAGDIAKPGSV